MAKKCRHVARVRDVKRDTRNLRKKEEHQPKSKHNTGGEKPLAAEFLVETKNEKRKNKKRHGQTDDDNAIKLPTPPTYNKAKVLEMQQKQKEITRQSLATPAKIWESHHPRIVELENSFMDTLNGKTPFEEDTMQSMETSFIKVLIYVVEKRNHAQEDWKLFAQRIFLCQVNKAAMNLIYGNCQVKSKQCKSSPIKLNADEESELLPENALSISRKFNATKSHAFATLTDVMMKKFQTDQIYIRLLGQNNLYDDLIRGTLSRRKRRQVKLDYRVLTAHIKLLEIIYADLVERCHHAFNGQCHESILRLVHHFKSSSIRMRTNIQRITDCIQARKRGVSNKKSKLNEVETELEDTNRQFESACNEFEELSKTSEEYKEALRTCERLTSEVEQVQEVNRQDTMELTKLDQRLDDMRNKLEHKAYTRELTARREAIESRNIAWKRRETTQESLKEIIRMKTGIILREEDMQSRLKKSIEKFQIEKQTQHETLNNLKLQRKRMMSKYHKFTLGYHDYHDKQKLVLSLPHLSTVC